MTVEEVEINGLICAGKRIHETLIEAGNAGVQRIVRKYVEECQLMSDMRHPHIVQFMGVCFLPDSSLPVLVMERLLMSLDDLLENTPDIPLSLKRSMLADVAKGLVYLHNRSSPIIHRDLSSKNTLLNSTMAAKISDLGNSRIIDLQPGQLVKTLSRIPGTLVYMPPEALYNLPGYEADKSHYGTKIDIFSFGHLCLFTITQDFPGDLLPPTYPDPNSRGRLIALTEVQRRRRYIDQLHRQLGEGHPIVQLVEQCLDNDPEYRPSSEDVLQRLEEMKGLIRDPYQDLTRVEMMKLLERKDREIQSQEQGIQAMEALRSQLQQVQLEISGSERALQAELTTVQTNFQVLQSDVATKDRQLQEKDRQLAAVQANCQALQSDISAKDRQLQENYTQLQGKDAHLQEKNRQLQEKDTNIQTLQSDLSTKNMLLSSVQADLEARETRMREEIRQKDIEIERLSKLGNLQPLLQTHQVEPILRPGASLLWKKCADLPVGISHAQAVVLKNKVYVGCGYTESFARKATLYIYTPMEDTWTTTPTPTRVSALTTYDSQLVLVGGEIVSTRETTNQLWVFREDEQTWRQPLAAMPTARRGASATSHHNHLIVAGGDDSNGREMNVVEIYYNGHQWMKTDAIPNSCAYIKTTIHNDTWYLMGGYGQGQSVFCASLQSLITKATQQSPASPSNSEQMSAWKTLPDVQYKYCNSATTVLRDALVAVGGRDHSKIPTPSLHTYSSHTHSWVYVDEMPVAVDSTCTITLTTGEMMMIGGKTKDTPYSRTVYKASIQT